MLVACLQFELTIHDASSLKDKRRVVKSLKDRLHREHLVSVAEVGALDSPSVAVMGLSVVGREGKPLASVLDKIQQKLMALHDAELVACRREFLRLRDEEPAEGSMDTDALAAEMLGYAEGEQE